MNTERASETLGTVESESLGTQSERARQNIAKILSPRICDMRYDHNALYYLGVVGQQLLRIVKHLVIRQIVIIWMYYSCTCRRVGTPHTQAVYCTAL